MPSSTEERLFCLLVLLVCLATRTDGGLFDRFKGKKDAKDPKDNNDSKDSSSKKFFKAPSLPNIFSSSFPDTFRKLAKSECILVIRFPQEPNQKDQATRDCSGHLIKATPSGGKAKDASDFILTSAHCFSRSQSDSDATQQNSDGDAEDEQQQQPSRRRRRKRSSGWFFGGLFGKSDHKGGAAGGQGSEGQGAVAEGSGGGEKGEAGAGQGDDGGFVGEIFVMCGVEEYTRTQQVRIESTAAKPAVFLGDKYSGNRFDARNIALIPIGQQCSQMISKHKTLKSWKFQQLKLGGRPPFEGTTKKGETVQLMCKVIGWLGQEGTKPAITGQYDAEMVDPAKCTQEYKLDQNSPPICTMVAKSNKQPVTRCTIKDCSVCGTPLVVCQDKVGSKSFVPVAIGIMSKDGTQLDASTCFYYMADFFDRMIKFDPKDMTCEAYPVDLKRNRRR